MLTGPAGVTATNTQDTSAEVLPPAAATDPIPPPAAPTATPRMNLTSTTTSASLSVPANRTATVPPVPLVGRKTAVKDASQQGSKYYNLPDDHLHVHVFKNSNFWIFLSNMISFLNQI